MGVCITLGLALYLALATLIGATNEKCAWSVLCRLKKKRNRNREQQELCYSHREEIGLISQLFLLRSTQAGNTSKVKD